MGIEPTWDPYEPHTDFEDQGRHQEPITSKAPIRNIQPRKNTAVSSLITVHGLAGDWSVFRREITFCQKNVGRKHGPVPFPRREGDSPL
jgi:hypothetical protein